MATVVDNTAAYALKKWNVRHQRQYLMHKQKTKTLVISQIGASSFSMWRVVSLLLIIGISDYYRLIKFTSATLSNFHTEGGSFPSASRRLNKQLQRQAAELETQPSAYDYETNNDIQNNKYWKASPIYDDNEDLVDDHLVNNVKALSKQQDYIDYIFTNRPLYKNLNDKTPALAVELNKFGKQIKELEGKEKQNEENYIEQPSSLNESEKPLTAQKKGQSEFVEFIDPHANNVHSKTLKNVEWLEKRAPSNEYADFNQRRTFGLLSSSGNIIFLALVALCCVFSVVGVVGGMYYYKRARTIREDPFDDFTRYSPAGPGRDRLKKTGNGRSLFNNTNGTILPLGGDKGDDVLAYKAQLHHYQQTKQKIIGTDSDAISAQRQSDNTSDKSEDEDETDLEHNFSVYECPGLAPTGDIEVQNPNFIDSTTK